MNFLTSLVTTFLQKRRAKKNIIVLSKFLFVLTFIVTLYSVLFHVLMLHEGKEYSWVTGFYWTLTVMSTLGFGDITFKTDLGLLFSIIVLMSGIILLLIMLPFIFIRFFYDPWLAAQTEARTPRRLPEDTSNHIILTNLDAITINLIKKFELKNYQYVLLASEMDKAIEYYDLGYKVVFGDYSVPETYMNLRIKNALMAIVTNDDAVNTSISFTIREVCEDIPIVAKADAEHSIDILEFAGSTHVYHFTQMLGESLANRVLGVNKCSNVIGHFGELLIAEVNANQTPLEGKTLQEVALRKTTGLTAVGIWNRGEFQLPNPKTVFTSSMVIILAGSQDQFSKFNEFFCLKSKNITLDPPVLILGGGRVGKAAAKFLKESGVAYRIVEKSSREKGNDPTVIHGNAADIEVLNEAGIRQAKSVIITTHNDATNIYLTIYCRQLRPDIQIISRATRNRSVSKLHRGGADIVISYALLGTNTIMNLINPEGIVTVAEELNIFRSKAKNSLVGVPLSKSRIREETGCSIIGICRNDEIFMSPDPGMQIEEGDELIVVGTTDAERLFNKIDNG